MNIADLVAVAEEAHRREGERRGTRLYDLHVRPNGLMIDIRDYTHGGGPKKACARGVLLWDEFEKGGFAFFRNSLDLMDATVDRNVQGLDA